MSGGDLSHLDSYYLGGPVTPMSQQEVDEYAAWKADYRRRNMGADERTYPYCWCSEIPGRHTHSVEIELPALETRPGATFGNLMAVLEAARPLARLPLPVSSDERVEWLTHQQKLADALAYLDGGS